MLPLEILSLMMWKAAEATRPSEPATAATGIPPSVAVTRP
uniref:Uncharacterized protein n=1 Tax=Arundo donax TaxID=35708 RepID=A0A0A8YTQ6_ARUDO